MAENKDNKVFNLNMATAVKITSRFTEEPTWMVQKSKTHCVV